MSDKDEKLISKATSLPYSDWMYIDDFVEEAESEEAKKRLRSIQNNKYHREEYYTCGSM